MAGSAFVHATHMYLTGVGNRATNYVFRNSTFIIFLFGAILLGEGKIIYLDETLLSL